MSIISRGNAGGRYSTEFGANYTFLRVQSIDFTNSSTIMKAYSRSTRISIRGSLTPPELGKLTLYPRAHKHTSAYNIYSATVSNGLVTSRYGMTGILNTPARRGTRRQQQGLEECRSDGNYWGGIHEWGHNL